MANSPPTYRGRPPTTEENALVEWFDKQASDPFPVLEEAARQIIQLVTALYAVVFGILAFASDPVPTYLAHGSVRGIGIVCVLGYLVALIAALIVVIPRGYRPGKANVSDRRAMFHSIIQRKAVALSIAVWAFGIASVAFASLLVTVIFGW